MESGLLLLALAVAGIAAAIGASMAPQRGLSAPLMALVSFVFPIAVVVLAFVPVKYVDAQSDKSAGSNGAANSEKWVVLKSVDLDIAEAAAEVAALGPGFEDKLAQQFLVLNDKSYLIPLVDRLVQERSEIPSWASQGLLEVDGHLFDKEGHYLCRNCGGHNLLGDKKCALCWYPLP